MVIEAVTVLLVLLAGISVMREWAFWRGDGAGGDPPCRRIAVIVPVKGLVHQVERNLEAVTRQDIPADYVFVVDDVDDPAYPLVQRYGRVIVAGRGDGPGKSRALAAALREVKADCIVFADDDIRPRPDWLRQLVSRLSQCVASTTYRWYVGRGIHGVVRAAISNMGFAAMQNRHSAFLWGGSTALRREVVDATRLWEWLGNYLSDDYATLRAVRMVGGQICFVREAIAPTEDVGGVWDAVRWGVRQVAMVKWHAPRGWAIGLAIYTASFLFGLAVPIAGLALGRLPMSVGLAIPLLALAKDAVRASGIRRRANIEVHPRTVLATWLVGLVVVPLTVILSAFARCVEWRGAHYCGPTRRA